MGCGRDKIRWLQKESFVRPMPPRTRSPAVVTAWGVLTLATFVAAGPVNSHEFWLEAIEYTPKTGASVPIVFRNGQGFIGDSYPYLRKLAKRFTVTDTKGDRGIKAIEGDDPAGEVKFAQPGLAIVAYQSNPETVTFDTFARFLDNLKEEGLEALGALHQQQGKPASGIRELFTRHAKALVQVGNGPGNDRPLGLPLELVAETNPYLAAPGSPITVRLLHNGRPLAGTMLKTFHLKDAQSPRRVRTDAEGRATIELPLAGEYLINAVHMLEPRPADKAHWFSLWASLTFDRPR